MSNIERDYESLVFRLEQLSQNQQVLAKYMAEMKRQLDGLNEQFNNLPELSQRTSLQDALSQLNQQFEQRLALPLAPVEVTKSPPEEPSYKDEIQRQLMQVQSYESQLVFDRSGSRAVLIEALLKAQNRLIIACPWLSRNSIDADLMQKFRDCLNRNCRIDIGWGYLSGRDKTGKGLGNKALQDLRKLEQDYPKQFKLKLMGTHEKFLVCDSSFSMLGSHNMLSSNARGVTREVGIRTTDPQIIQGLINRFDGTFDAEALDVQYTGEESDAIVMNPEDGAFDQDIDDAAEDEQATVIDAEELARRYKAGERDFTGINLARVDLTSMNLDNAFLIEANLSGTNLTKANLLNARLLQANLSKANLSQASLLSANLTTANLSGANLINAKLDSANLTAASLIGANLINANLNSANLTAADLNKAKLTNTSLSSTNLSGANLTGVNLVGVDLRSVKLSGADLSGAKLCGANLGSKNLSGVNLTKADIRGANLENADLEKANLTGANLGGVNLKGAKLSGAIMPDGTVHE